MTITALLKSAGFTNSVYYVYYDHQSLAQMHPVLAHFPPGFGKWLQALAYALSKPREIAIVGDPEAAGTQALLNIARGGFRPFQIVALGTLDGERPAVPLLQNRRLVSRQAAAYVCRDFTCQAPITEPEALQALLKG